LTDAGRSQTLLAFPEDLEAHYEPVLQGPEVRGRARRNLDLARPPAAALARQDEHPVSKLDEPLGPDAEVLPSIRDPRGIGADAFVTAMRAGDVREDLRATPLDVLRLEAQDGLEVGPVDRVVDSFQRCDVFSHAQ
jgi:hypothetical protein